MRCRQDFTLGIDDGKAPSNRHPLRATRVLTRQADDIFTERKLRTNLRREDITFGRRGLGADHFQDHAGVDGRLESELRVKIIASVLRFNRAKNYVLPMRLLGVERLRSTLHVGFRASLRVDIGHSR